MNEIARASARKSLGEYKPVIEYPGVCVRKTEVVEQSPERATTYTRNGSIQGNRMARGTTYANREDAIAAAQRVIDVRRADAEKALAETLARSDVANRGSVVERLKKEIEFWGA